MSSSDVTVCSCSTCECSSSDERSQLSSRESLGEQGEQTPTQGLTLSVYTICVDPIRQESEESSLLIGSPVRAETWGIEDVRRHWVLKDHCDVLYFPCQDPNLALPTKLGRYLWYLHRASGQPSPYHIKTLARCALGIVRDLNLYEPRPQLGSFIICDNLLDVSWLDCSNRKKYIDGLEAFLSTQRELKMVSFENSRMKRKEGARLLMSLGVACGSTLDRLYMWQMFARDENPILKDTTYCKYRDKGAFKGSSTCKISFWRAMIRFSALTILAINYGYLADRRHGNGLLMIASVLTGTLQELQILCLEDEIPNHHKCNDFDGFFYIRDGMWKKALGYCPELEVSMVFVTVPRYEDIMAILTPSIPLHHFYLSSGIDLRFRDPWSVDRTLQMLEIWYPNTLEVICLHLWRNREGLDATLINTLANFPKLTTLDFCGTLYNDDTIRQICEKIRLAPEPLSITKIKFLVQETYTTQDVECGVFTTDKNTIESNLEDIRATYKDLFIELDIELDIRTCPY